MALVPRVSPAVHVDRTSHSLAAARLARPLALPVARGSPASRATPRGRCGGLPPLPLYPRVYPRGIGTHGPARVACLRAPPPPPLVPQVSRGPGGSSGAGRGRISKHPRIAPLRFATCHRLGGRSRSPPYPRG